MGRNADILKKISQKPSWRLPRGKAFRQGTGKRRPKTTGTGGTSLHASAAIDTTRCIDRKVLLNGSDRTGTDANTASGTQVFVQGGNRFLRSNSLPGSERLDKSHEFLHGYLGRRFVLQVGGMNGRKITRKQFFPHPTAKVLGRLQVGFIGTPCCNRSIVGAVGMLADKRCSRYRTETTLTHKIFQIHQCTLESTVAVNGDQYGRTVVRDAHLFKTFSSRHRHVATINGNDKEIRLHAFVKVPIHSTPDGLRNLFPATGRREAHTY